MQNRALNTADVYSVEGLGLLLALERFSEANFVQILLGNKSERFSFMSIFVCQRYNYAGELNLFSVLAKCESGINHI
jgi:hypothetical protein